MSWTTTQWRTSKRDLRAARGVRMPGSPDGMPLCPHGRPLRVEGCSDCLADAVQRAASHPSVPEGPWRIVRAPHDDGDAYVVVREGGNIYDGDCGWWKSEAEAIAVRDALNAVAARLPREAAP